MQVVDLTNDGLPGHTLRADHTVWLNCKIVPISDTGTVRYRDKKDDHVVIRDVNVLCNKYFDIHRPSGLIDLAVEGYPGYWLNHRILWSDVTMKECYPCSGKHTYMVKVQGVKTRVSMLALRDKYFGPREKTHVPPVVPRPIDNISFKPMEGVLSSLQRTLLFSGYSFLLALRKEATELTRTTFAANLSGMPSKSEMVDFLTSLATIKLEHLSTGNMDLDCAIKDQYRDAVRLFEQNSRTFTTADYAKSLRALGSEYGDTVKLLTKALSPVVASQAVPEANVVTPPPRPVSRTGALVMVIAIVLRIKRMFDDPKDLITNLIERSNAVSGNKDATHVYMALNLTLAMRNYLACVEEFRAKIGPHSLLPNTIIGTQVSDVMTPARTLDHSRKVATFDDAIEPLTDMCFDRTAVMDAIIVELRQATAEIRKQCARLKQEGELQKPIMLQPKAEIPRVTTPPSKEAESMTIRETIRDEMTSAMLAKGAKSLAPHGVDDYLLLPSGVMYHAARMQYSLPQPGSNKVVSKYYNFRNNAVPQKRCASALYSAVFGPEAAVPKGLFNGSTKISIPIPDFPGGVDLKQFGAGAYTMFPNGMMYNHNMAVISAPAGKKNQLTYTLAAGNGKIISIAAKLMYIAVFGPDTVIPAYIAAYDCTPPDADSSAGRLCARLPYGAQALARVKILDRRPAHAPRRSRQSAVRKAAAKMARVHLAGGAKPIPPDLVEDYLLLPDGRVFNIQTNRYTMPNLIFNGTATLYYRLKKGGQKTNFRSVDLYLLVFGKDVELPALVGPRESESVEPKPVPPSNLRECILFYGICIMMKGGVVPDRQPGCRLFSMLSSPSMDTHKFQDELQALITSSRQAAIAECERTKNIGADQYIADYCRVCVEDEEVYFELVGAINAELLAASNVLQGVTDEMRKASGMKDTQPSDQPPPAPTTSLPVFTKVQEDMVFYGMVVLIRGGSLIGQPGQGLGVVLTEYLKNPVLVCPTHSALGMTLARIKEDVDAELQKNIGVTVAYYISKYIDTTTANWDSFRSVVAVMSLAYDNQQKTARVAYPQQPIIPQVPSTPVVPPAQFNRDRAIRDIDHRVIRLSDESLRVIHKMTLELTLVDLDRERTKLNKELASL